MFGLKIGSPNLLSSYKNKLLDMVIAPDLLPIAEDNACRICLFLDGIKKGQIHYWFNEELHIPYNYANLYFIADSFDEFMQIVYPLTEN